MAELRRGRFLYAAVTAVLLFAAPVASAQQAQVTLNVSPEHPRQQQVVTLSVTSASMDVSRARITWYRNGASVLDDLGASRYSFRLGNVGTTETIRVVAQSSGGAVGEATATLRPADVLLVWQSDSYAPPLYRGKTLRATESRLTVTAIPNVVVNGSRVSASSLVFTWEQDGLVLGGQSGVGRSSLTIPGTILARPIEIGVTVETVGGSVHTERRASISVAKPIVRLYERDQLLGILFERALSGTFALRREETTVEAFPFFFSTRARDAGLSYEWRLGGARLEGKTDPSVLLRQVGATGQTNLSVNVSGFDTVLESAKSSVGIDFGR